MDIKSGSDGIGSNNNNNVPVLPPRALNNTIGGSFISINALFNKLSSPVTSVAKGHFESESLPLTVHFSN